MTRIRRILASLLVAAAVTAGVAAVTPKQGRSALLLAGVALVYFAAAVLALRHPEALRRTDGPNWTSGAFAAVLTLGCLSLLSGVPGGPNAAVVALGYGLGAFGLVAGIAIERER